MQGMRLTRTALVDQHDITMLTVNLPSGCEERRAFARGYARTPGEIKEWYALIILLECWQNNNVQLDITAVRTSGIFRHSQHAASERILDTGGLTGLQFDRGCISGGAMLNQRKHDAQGEQKTFDNGGSSDSRVADLSET